MLIRLKERWNDLETKPTSHQTQQPSMVVFTLINLVQIILNLAVQRERVQRAVWLLNWEYVPYFPLKVLNAIERKDWSISE